MLWDRSLYSLRQKCHDTSYLEQLENYGYL